MIEEIKKLRVKIDGLAQLTKELKPIKDRVDIHFKYNSLGGYGVFIGNESDEIKNKEKEVQKKLKEYINKSGENSKEIEKAVDSLYLAKAWLGKILGELGTENPYGSGYKTKEDIVPTADSVRILEIEKDYITDKKWSEMNHIEKVDWLREEIKRIIDTTEDFSMYVPEIELEQGFVYKYLCEARFWLGFELERIKNDNSH